MLTGSSLGHWHPLTWMTLALDRAVWGPGPFGYHLGSVLWHVLNAALFFLLARRLLRPAGRDARAADLGALLAALTWALHPLRVESVAWVSERRDVVSGAFVLGTLLAWTIGAEAGDTPAGGRFRRLAFVLGSAAMASKVFTVVLPGILLILDARLRGRPRWREKIPWLAPVALSLGCNVAAQVSSGAAVTLSAFGLPARLLQAAFGLAFYARASVWPFGLSPLYETSATLTPLPFELSAVAVIAAAVALWTQRRRRPWLVQAAVAYALFALPALGLFKSGRMTAADRYSYLPCLPLALLAGAALTRAAARPAARAVAVLALVLLAAATHAQLPVWSSDVDLWTRACESSPLSYFARVRLSAAQSAAGDAAAARTTLEEAQAVHRDVFTRAAALARERGDQAAAEAYARRAQDGLQFAP